MVNGGFTDDTNPTLSGTAEALSHIVIYDGALNVGTTDADALGNWTVTVPGTFFGDGAHSLTATAQDSSGNTSVASAARTFTVDTSAPTVVITDDEPKAVSNIADTTTTFTFTWSEAPVGFTNADVTLTGGTGTLVQDDPTHYHLTVTPTANTNGGTISVSLAGGVATDAAGNASVASSPVTQAYDTLAPVALSLGLANDTGTAADLVTSDATLSIAGQEGGATVEVNVNGGGWANIATYNPATMADGAYSVMVRQSDLAGNPSPTSALAFTLDKTAPTVVVTDNQSDSVISTSDGNVTFTFTFSEAVSGFDFADLVISGTDGNEMAGNFSGSGSTYSLVLTPGSSNAGTVSVSFAAGVASDLAGNTNASGAVATQNYDTVAPTITVTPIDTADLDNHDVDDPEADGDATGTIDVITSNPHLTVNPSETISLTEYSTDNATWFTDYDTSIVPALDDTGATLNTVYVRVTDVAGNVSASQSAVFAYDAAPVVTIFSPADNGTVAANSNLVATFSEAIQFTGPGAAANVQLIDLDNFNSLTAATATIAGNLLTIDPALNLISGHHYAITVANGTIEEAAAGGVDVVGWTDATTWNFTVA